MEAAIRRAARFDAEGQLGSVNDVVELVTGVSACNAARALLSATRDRPHLPGLFRKAKLPGHSRPAMVAPVPALLELASALPGRAADRWRASNADAACAPCTADYAIACAPFDESPVPVDEPLLEAAALRFCRDPAVLAACGGSNEAEADLLAALCGGMLEAWFDGCEEADSAALVRGKGHNNQPRVFMTRCDGDGGGGGYRVESRPARDMAVTVAILHCLTRALLRAEIPTLPKATLEKVLAYARSPSLANRSACPAEVAAASGAIRGVLAAGPERQQERDALRRLAAQYGRDGRPDASADNGGNHFKWEVRHGYSSAA